MDDILWVFMELFMGAFLRSWGDVYGDGSCDMVVYLLEEGVIYLCMCRDLLDWAYCGDRVWIKCIEAFEYGEAACWKPLCSFWLD